MIHVFVPCYNAAPFIDRAIASVVKQTYTNWKLHIYDDASTDGSFDTIAAIVRDWVNAESRYAVHLMSCPQNFGQGHAYQNFLAYEGFDPRDVMVTLDADDALFDRETLGRIADVFSDPDVWVAWGSYVNDWGEGKFTKGEFAQPLEDAKNVRQMPWVTSHVRCVRIGLLRHAGDIFRGPDGFPLRTAIDQAIMLPCIELAGQRRCRFMRETNYIYNRANPESLTARHRPEQSEMGLYVRSLPARIQIPYGVKLESLSDG